MYFGQIFLFVLLTAVYKCNAECNVMKLASCAQYMGEITKAGSKPTDEQKKAACKALENFKKCLKPFMAECKNDQSYKSYEQITTDKKAQDMCGGADSYRVGVWVSLLFAVITMVILH